MSRSPQPPSHVVGLLLTLAGTSGCAAELVNHGPDCIGSLPPGTVFVGTWAATPPTETVILTRQGTMNHSWRVEPSCRAPGRNYAALNAPTVRACRTLLSQEARVGAAFQDPTLLQQLAAVRGESKRRVELSLTTSKTFEMTEPVFYEQLEGVNCQHAEAYVRRVHLGSHMLALDSSDAGSLWSRWFGAEAEQSRSQQTNNSGTPVLYEIEWIQRTQDVRCPAGQIANRSTGRCEAGAAGIQFELSVGVQAAPTLCWGPSTAGPCQLSFTVSGPGERRDCWLAPGAITGACTLERPLSAAELLARPLSVQLSSRQAPISGSCAHTFGEAEVQSAAATGMAASQIACGSYSVGWQLRAKR